MPLKNDDITRKDHAIMKCHCFPVSFNPNGCLGRFGSFRQGRTVGPADAA